MGSESINPKIQLSERSFCEHLFYQPLGWFFVNGNTILFNKSKIYYLLQTNTNMGLENNWHST
jgi:hypothetical protein